MSCFGLPFGGGELTRPSTGGELFRRISLALVNSEVGTRGGGRPSFYFKTRNPEEALPQELDGFVLPPGTLTRSILNTFHAFVYTFRIFYIFRIFHLFTQEFHMCL